MVCIPESLEMVDLLTPDRSLEELMVQEYPDPITGNQHFIDRSHFPSKLYCFSGLRKNVLLAFLNVHGHGYSYAVRRSWDGSFLYSHNPPVGRSL